ncbi:hypothetical protein [Clostridium sp. 1001271B_151109_B4]|uniref:hypothetical protein n=1 Tax=Clostridium sp. 1001271B_151109_B4 TaxID=2787148 RepID=UPI0018AA930A|nr:hypothetical protein [Clostridium sp. 1001271B_151109_B4]
MGEYFKRIKDEIVVLGSIILVLVISIFLSKIFLIRYGDVLLYLGSIIVVLGFLDSVLQNDKIDIDKVIIGSGLFVIVLSCLI